MVLSLMPTYCWTTTAAATTAKFTWINSRSNNYIHCSACLKNGWNVSSLYRNFDTSPKNIIISLRTIPLLSQNFYGKNCQSLYICIFFYEKLNRAFIKKERKKKDNDNVIPNEASKKKGYLKDILVSFGTLNVKKRSHWNQNPVFVKEKELKEFFWDPERQEVSKRQSCF